MSPAEEDLAAELNLYRRRRLGKLHGDGLFAEVSGRSARGHGGHCR